METEAVLTVLRRVLDPEHPINIVEMGLVKSEDVTISDDTITVEFAPTSPICPMGAVIGIIMRKALEDAGFNRRIIVKVKPGSHMREADCNTMIMDDQQYQNAIERLKQTGALDRLITEA